MRPRAKGRFTLRANVTHHVMVATVTGVVPYVSMVRQVYPQMARLTPADALATVSSSCTAPVTVMSSCTTVRLRRLSEEHPHAIQYVSSVSRPSAARNAGWNGPVGRINTILEECLIDRRRTEGGHSGLPMRQSRDDRRCEGTSAASRLVGSRGAVLATTETWRTGRWQTRNVKDLMNPDIMTVADEMTTDELARYLIEQEISGAPVVDSQGHLIGVVSMTDIGRKMAEPSDVESSRSSGFYRDTPRTSRWRISGSATSRNGRSPCEMS